MRVLWAEYHQAVMGMEGTRSMPLIVLEILRNCCCLDMVVCVYVCEWCFEREEFTASSFHCGDSREGNE